MNYHFLLTIFWNFYQNLICMETSVYNFSCCPEFWLSGNLQAALPYFMDAYSHILPSTLDYLKRLSGLCEAWETDSTQVFVFKIKRILTKSDLFSLTLLQRHEVQGTYLFIVMTTLNYNNLLLGFCSDLHSSCNWIWNRTHSLAWCFLNAFHFSPYKGFQQSTKSKQHKKNQNILETLKHL